MPDQLYHLGRWITVALFLFGEMFIIKDGASHQVFANKLAAHQAIARHGTIKKTAVQKLIAGQAYVQEMTVRKVFSLQSSVQNLLFRKAFVLQAFIQKVSGSASINQKVIVPKAIALQPIVQKVSGPASINQTVIVQPANAPDVIATDLIRRSTNAQQMIINPAKVSDIQRLIEEIDGLIHKYGLYRDSLDWNQIYREINKLKPTDPDSTNHRLVLSLFTENLRKAGDNHSFFITTSAAKSYAKQEKNAPLPSGRYLGSGIALITVPYCFNNQKAKDIRFANTIREQIRKVDTRHKITVWMIDLRNNVGGNMWPMLAGLNALIEDGTVGYFINPASNSEQPWPSYNGKLMFPNAKVNNYKVQNRDIKIAVLIDSMTASSGEMTAVSFIGLSNVKTLGQPSAGYTTANTTYYLSDGTMFNLATSYIADRNMKPYMDRITPDIILQKNGSAGVEEAMKKINEWSHVQTN